MLLLREIFFSVNSPLNRISSKGCELHPLLETDDATWRFRHKILQDYFAKVWVEENAKS